MNRRHYKKVQVISSLLLVVLFICGFDWNEKKIKLTEKGLLDLNKAIQTSILGVDSTDEESDDQSDQEETSDTDEEISESSKSDTNEEIPVVKIVVHGKVVNYKGEPYEIAKLLDSLSNLNGQQHVKLEDDYAEAHLYHDLDAKLNNLCKNKGFEYDAD